MQLRAHQIWRIYCFQKSEMFEMLEHFFERTFSFTSATGFAQTSILCTSSSCTMYITLLDWTALHRTILHWNLHFSAQSCTLLECTFQHCPAITPTFLKLQCTWLGTSSALQWCFSKISFSFPIWRWLSLFSAPFWRTSLGLSVKQLCGVVCTVTMQFQD